MTVLNSSREENRWPTWRPEYISVMVARAAHAAKVNTTEQP
jgi:hypothetical protein